VNRGSTASSFLSVLALLMLACLAAAQTRDAADDRPSFMLSVSPSSQTVTAGSSITYTISVSALRGFTGTVDLSVSGVGLTSNLSPSSISGGSGSAVLQVTTSSYAYAGTYGLTIMAASGSALESASVTLKVMPQDYDGTVDHWLGYTWDFQNGEPAGGGTLIAYKRNMVVDSNGYLHVNVREKDGTYTDAEMYTRNLFSFGTFQWVLQGTNYYKMDPPLVLGLFSYGPNAGVGVDGENEIDIEFSNWNGEGVPNQVADFTVYPSTGNGTDGQIDHERDFYVPTPETDATTARFVWTSTSVEFYLMAGTVPVNQPPTDVFHHWTYDGTNTVHGVRTTDPTKWIPQDPCPVDINLWNFDGRPKHTWDIVVQEFDYLPAQ
jgi:hypothetical protein